MTRLALRGWVAHFLTSLRLLLIAPVSVALVAGWRTSALLLYLAAVASDVADGRVARRNGSASNFGALFDGIADLGLAIAAVTWVYVFFPEVRTLVLGYSAAAGLIFLAYTVLSFAATGGLLLVHLWSGKVTGTLAFSLFPVMILGGAQPWLVHLVGWAACLHFGEAAIYLLRGRRDPNGKTAFF